MSAGSRHSTIYRMTTATHSRLIPASLVLLGLVPVIAGSLRVAELAGGPGVLPEQPRFIEAPIPVLLHIIGAIIFAMLGAFQFAPNLRRKRPGWHRMAGRIIVPSGLTVALSGIWMALFYNMPAEDRGALAALRVFFGTAMAVCIVLGFIAIRRRDFVRHRAWMIRGYAIGLGAGTQALTLTTAVMVLGSGEAGRSVGHAVGWLINLAVAEWIIRRKATRRVAGGRARAVAV